MVSKALGDKLLRGKAAADRTFAACQEELGVLLLEVVVALVLRDQSQARVELIEGEKSTVVTVNVISESKPLKGFESFSTVCARMSDDVLRTWN